MPPRKSPARAAKKSAAGASGYDFDSGEHEQEVVVLAGKLKAVKGKDNIVKCLKQLRTMLEGLPQDVESLGGAQETLPGLLLQHATSDNADKDVRMYGAICLVQLMRVFAPDLPYDDDQLRLVYELLVDCWSRLEEAGPGYDLARSMLASYAEVKLYIPLLDLEDADLVGRTFAGLLQAVRADNAATLADVVMSVLLGMIEESEQPPEEVVDILLAALVAGQPALSGAGAKAAAAQYSDAARGLAARLLAKGGDVLRGALQRRVLSCVRRGLQGLDAAGGTAVGPGRHSGRGAAGGKAAAAAVATVAAAADGDTGGAAYDPFTLLHGLHGSAPQLLLPVLPELKGQLRQEDEHRRLAAAALVTRLLAAPPPGPLNGGGGGGGAASSLAVTGASAGALASSAPMAAHYPDLVQELLQRYTDTSPAVRVAMLGRTPQLAAVAAAAAPDGGLERQVLGATRARLHDLEDKVRAAACRAVCALAVAAAAGPPTSLLPPGGPAPPPLLDNEVLALLREEVAPRLRDRKIGVRREAAAGLLAAWRGTCTALQQGAMNMPGLVRAVGWVPARLCADLVRDLELRPHLMALLATPMAGATATGAPGGGAVGGAKAAKGGVGLLPASLGQRVGSAVWAALWASYGAQDRAAVRKALALKARAALLLQELVELRGQVRAAARAEDEARVQKLRPRLMHVCAELSAAAGGPAEGQARGSEQLVRLVGEARDSFLFDRLAQLAAPTTTAEAAAAARKDALSRLPGGGSKAPVAELITRLAAAAAPTLMAPSHVAGLIAALDSAGGAKRDTSVVTAAAALAVVAAKSAPAVFALAMPLVAGVVTAAPAKGELATVTAVRVLRHAARYCAGTPLAGVAAAGARTDADGNGDDVEEKENEHAGASEEDDEEDQEEKGQEASPAKGKKRGRAAADSTKASSARRKRRASGGDADDGKPSSSPSAAAGKRHTRGQQAAAADAAAGKAAPGQGGAGPVSAAAVEARSALLASLQELCFGPYRKAAKAAVHALSILLLQPQSQPQQPQLARGGGGGSSGSGREHRAGVLRALAERLAAALVPGCEASAGTAAAIEAMGSLGEVEPALFTDYAAEYVAFITQDYMAATLRDPARLAARQAAVAAAAVAADGGGGGGGARRKSRPSSAQALAAGLAEEDDDDEEDGEGGAEWGKPSYGVAMKAAALRALARGVTPNANARADAAAPLPTATVAAVMGPPHASGNGARPSTSRAPAAVAVDAGGGGAVEELLVRLLNVEEELEEFGVRHDVDRAHLRYTAARCLLHLARRYDSRLGSAAYTALALAMQDPYMEVRRDVGDKVRMFLHTALQLGMRASTRSRYAAMLPLAVVDPIPEHAEAAARTLRELVLLTRSRMAAAALATATGAAAAAGASSRPSLGDAPEFLLAHLVYVLAHHPDVAIPPERYPQAGKKLRMSEEGADEDEQEEDTQGIPDPEEYRPFQDMLQLALEALLVPRGPGQGSSGGGGGGGGGAAAKPLGLLAAGAGEALPAVCKILRSVKITMYDADDTVDTAASTRTVRLMADMGLAVAKAIVTRELTAAAAAGGGGTKGGKEGGRARSKPVDTGAIAEQVEALSWREHPGQVVVPRALYRLARPEEQPKGLKKDGSCLPPGYVILLSPTIAGLGLRAPASGSGGSTAAGPAGRGEDGVLLPPRQQASAGSSGGDGPGAAGSGGVWGGVVMVQPPEGQVDDDGVDEQAVGRRTGAAVKRERSHDAPQAGRGRGAKQGAGAPARAQQRTTPTKKPRGGYESLSEGEESELEEEDEEESDQEGEDEQEREQPAAQVAKPPAKRAAATAKPMDAYDLPEEDDTEEEEEAELAPQPAAGKGARARGAGASKSPPAAQATERAAAPAARGGAAARQPPVDGANRKEVRGIGPAAAAAAAAMDTSPSSPDENASEDRAPPRVTRGSERINGFGYTTAATASGKPQLQAKTQRQPLKQHQQAAQQRAGVAEADDNSKQRSKPPATAAAVAQKPAKAAAARAGRRL